MWAQANGIRIRYSLDGPPGAPLITFSHSLATSSALWELQAQAFRDRYRVLRYDNRGHGGTTVTEGPYTFGLLADDVRALLDVLGEAGTHFVGLSNGGMIGQSLALRHPDVVRSLVLCDTTSRPPREMLPVWEERARTAEREGMEPIVESTIGRWFTKAYQARHPGTVESFRTLIRNTSTVGYAACCRAIQQFDVTDEIRRIRVPTLILVGEQDQGTTVAEHEVIHDRIAGSELVVFPDTAHLSNVMAVDEFNRCLGEFLARRDDEKERST
jgi:3-oxoadipate enol-lactonase